MSYGFLDASSPFNTPPTIHVSMDLSIRWLVTNNSQRITIAFHSCFCVYTLMNLSVSQLAMQTQSHNHSILFQNNHIMRDSCLPSMVMYLFYLQEQTRERNRKQLFSCQGQITMQYLSKTITITLFINTIIVAVIYFYIIYGFHCIRRREICLLRFDISVLINVWNVTWNPRFWFIQRPILFSLPKP